MSDKVQFQTNVPVEVALKYNDGKEVNGPIRRPGSVYPHRRPRHVRTANRQKEN